jgi:3'-5' exoribonuclease
MKSPYVGTLPVNEPVTALFLVLSKEIRQKKTGEPYLTLHLSDRTGELEAKMWDNVTEVMDTFERDDFLKVKGLVQIYQNRTQFTIHKLRRLDEHEVDLADYFPCSERDPEEMFAELRGIVNGFSNPHLQALVNSVLDDSRLANPFKMAPAAKTIHHAYRGGLLEHVLSLCQLSRLTAAHYKTLDLDLLLTGAILHDLGKLEELSFDRGFGYSSDGQLLGHIILGLRMLNSKFEKLPNFPVKLRTLVEHMIVSHHGELEFGSPKVPIFAEAMLLHHLDNLDSKMNAIQLALQRDRQVEGEFTGWIAPLERVLLKKDRYLAPPKAAAPVAPAPLAPAAVLPLPPAQPAAPAVPLPPAAVTLPAPPPAKPAAYRPPQNTLFAEKLQAVLEPHK